MTRDVKQTEQQFRQLMQQMDAYNQAIGLMNWDLRTKAPKKGAEQRSNALGTLSTEVFKIQTSDEMKAYIDEILESDDVSPISKRSAEELNKNYMKMKKIPEEEYKEYEILASQTESVWAEAKENGDFSSFQPYLEKIIDFKKRFLGYWGYEGHPYNTLLDDYEPGMTVDTLDNVFTELRDGLTPLVEGVMHSDNKPETDFLFTTFPKANQEAFSLDVLNSMQYDFEAGRLDETVHPFALNLNPYDVRVTTKYDESDFRTAVFGTIHEGGHALYEQNISEELLGTVLCGGTSMGIHESQSLFWENFVGRHYGFWENHYDKLKRQANGQFDSIPLNTFYKAINEAKPSLIRIEADEMTYSLHVILRYELEKAIISGDLQVQDLPSAWNEKMKEYLGVEPPHDGVGVLQDVHWAFGAFGYFPSYALGYIYAAQFKNAMVKDLPQFDDYVQAGNLAPIKEWLTKHIHQHGSMKKPVDILQDVTGEGTNPKPLLAYLSSKYKELYQF
ncbi:carboxypeptidase M32 [Salsuginibacillus kocurii]|uniref:carboxypeptidase M32 n=1 Tax=Salsuginibacillus kocurii TaxID=427078 RepID=UPI000371E796|nr:carboxypeptidase M32 [Salsuginibacillus kocurii]